jgi:serine protease DegQ
VKTVMESIIKTGQVTRGWIGVELQDITPELADSFRLKKSSGAIIAGVIRGGPADSAGMRPGDILLAVEGEQVNSTADLLNMISQLQPGQQATLTILRQNQESKLSVQIGKRPRVKPVMTE